MTFLSRILGALLFGLLVILNLPAQAQTWQWATKQRVASTGNHIEFASTYATAITASGEVYAGHRFNGSFTLGAQTYASSVNGGAALAHYDSAGNFVSTLLVGDNAIVSALKIDDAGNLYASGSFSGQLTIGTTQTAAGATGAYFLAKWTPTGALSWLRVIPNTIPTNNPVGSTHLAIDGAGNVTLAASYTDSLRFGGRTLVGTPGVYSLLMAQFDASGGFRWWQTNDDPSSNNVNVFVTGLAAAPDGTLHVTGSSIGNSSFHWGPTAIQSFPAQECYWMKLTSTGAVLAQRAFGDRNSTLLKASRVMTDALGTAYVATISNTGTFIWGATSFAPPPGQTAGIFVVRLADDGTPTWVQNATLLNTGSVIGWAMGISRDPTASAVPRIYVGGQIHAAQGASDFLVCGEHSLFTTGSNQANGFLLALDGLSGAPEWLIPVATATGDDVVYALDANAAGQVSVGGAFVGTAAFGGRQLQDSLKTSYVAKLLPYYNQLQGIVFTDLNRNGALNAGEPGREGVVVEAQPGPVYFTTTSNGRYSAIADLGPYSLSVPNPPRYHTVVPTGPVTATFSTYGNVSGGHDFALQPILNQQDLMVTLTPVSRARPGFAVRYRLTARNVGTIVTTGATLHLTTDPLLTYVSSTAGGTHSGGATDWAIGTLQPGEARQLDALFQLAVTAPLGQVLTATATLDPLASDLTPADNTETNNLTVTGSYDPNDIEVNYATLTLPQVQNATKALDYTIRFQNMGTDTAFTVTLRDTLPGALLNLGTLQVLSASHTCTWRLGAGGVVTVSFPDIRLPDRNTNTLRSMGFVRFRVVPYTTLAVGDLIPNQAQIYFDFNAPVATNTALTTVVNPTDVAPETAGLTGGAWPNPATTLLHVVVARPAGAAVALTLVDALGREVRTAALPAAVGESAETTLDLRGLTPGLYVVRAAAGGRGWSQRVVVR